MLEYPEIAVISRQLQKETAGKMVTAVLPPMKPHKFCWFNGDPAGYEAQLTGSRITAAEGFGIFVELVFDNGRRLCFNDGVNVRLTGGEKPPAACQLLIRLDDGTALAFTVAMYGGIYLHDGSYGDEYYVKSRASPKRLRPAMKKPWGKRGQSSPPRRFWLRSSVSPASETACCRISCFGRTFIPGAGWSP